MHRRQYLATAIGLSSLGLAGCTGDEDESANGNSNTPEPTATATPEPTATATPEPALYRESQRDAMLLKESDLADRDWTLQPPDYNESFGAVWTANQEQIAVLNSVIFASSADRAVEGMQEVRNRLRSPQEFRAGDDAVWSEGQDSAAVAFRVRNAVSSLRGLRQSGLENVPALGLVQTAATNQAQRWQEEIETK